MNRRTSHPPEDWRDHLVSKNTFLHCPTPWVDAELQSDFLKNEANRPHSDPSSSRSSSCMSKSSSWDSSLEGRVAEARVRTLEHVQRPDGSKRGAPSTHPPRPELGCDARDQTSGAGAEAPAIKCAEGRCTPCKHFAKFGACRNGDDCGNCHLQHEPGHPGFKRRPGKSSRVRFEKMIQRLKERMAQDGDDFNLDDVEFLTAPMKQDDVLRAKIVKKLVEVVEHGGGIVRGTEFSRVAKPPADGPVNALVHVIATGPQPGSASSEITRDPHCDSDGDMFSL